MIISDVNDVSDFGLKNNVDRLYFQQWIVMKLSMEESKQSYNHCNMVATKEAIL